MEHITEFEKDFRSLINKHSLENDSDTPDFVLAKYLMDCLGAYGQAVKGRDKFFGVDMWDSEQNAQVSDTTKLNSSSKSQ